VEYAGVALRNLVVRRFGGEGVVPESLEASIRMGSLLDLDNLLAGHQEVGHSRDHILQEADLGQAGNFLEGEHSLQVGGLLVGLGLIVNWEGAVDVVASVSVGADWEQGPGDLQEEDRWVLGLVVRLAHGH